ncbi:hypothetical protein NL676_028722 [Syzygium grande]|nr:hypothetical protein NL676_028722 [Syzygium grande]
MYRRSECQSWQQSGWDTSSQEYHEHISRLARMPSVHPNVPQYPNVHTVFNSKVIREEESESQHNHHQRNHNHRSPQFQETVEVIEFKEERVEPYGDERVEVFEEVVDVKTDSFIQQKHRGFQPCKWNTSKAY